MENVTLVLVIINGPITTDINQISNKDKQSWFNLISEAWMNELTELLYEVCLSSSKAASGGPRWRDGETLGKQQQGLNAQFTPSTAPIRRVADCIWWHKNTSLEEECSDGMPKVLLQPCGACLELGDSLHLLGSPFVTGSKGPKAQSQGQLPADRLRLQRLSRSTPKMLLFPCLL